MSPDKVISLKVPVQVNKHTHTHTHTAHGNTQYHNKEILDTPRDAINLAKGPF